MNTILIYFTILMSAIHCRDDYNVRGNYNVGAQEMDYSNNVVAVSKLSDQTVQLYTAGTSTILRNIATTHKADITTIQFTSDGSKIATAGESFQVKTFFTNNGSAQCTLVGIRGYIKDLQYLNDNIRLVGVSNIGFAYIWNTSSCQLSNYRQFSGQSFTSVAVRVSASELWIANYKSTIYRVDYSLVNAGTSIVVATERLNSILSVGSTDNMAVCTENTFYLYSGTNLALTKSFLTTLMKSCRISPFWQNGYFISVASQYQQLFALWKLQLSGPSIWLVRWQTDDGRHGSGKPHTVQLYSYNYNAIKFVSSSANSNYINNQFLDTSTTICDTGLVASTRVTGISQCTLCTDIVNNTACASCSTDYTCNSCYTAFYRVSASKCVSCPNNCYTCSASACLSCNSNYVLSSGNCILCNMTGCRTCSISSSTVFCQKCNDGYFLVGNNDGCSLCNTSIPGCLTCSNRTVCTQCSSTYYLSNNLCSQCDSRILGCKECIVNTYCQTCDSVTYPYYNLVSSTSRICQTTCYYKCATCSFYYDNCDTCDSNRTRYFVSGTSYSCQCNSNYIEISTDKNCVLCSDLITNCLVCTNQTYCQACNTNYYFNPTAIGERSCLLCNYSCQTCSTNYSTCQTCSATGNRVLSSNSCVCVNSSYYQRVNVSSCSSCSSAISNCDQCLNNTYCVACLTGYYLNNVSSGNSNCQACSSTCQTCQTNASYCISCSAAQHRILNLTLHTCYCDSGYYNDGSSCILCSSILSACATCSNGTICQTCMPNNYFQLQGSLTVCNLCSPTCQTCNNYSDTCSSCNSSQNRVFDSVNKRCPCITGYTQVNSECIDCNSTFTYCNGCNATHCLSCQSGYALSQDQVQCMNCSATIIGCLTCLNGGCAQCNSSLHFKVSRLKCICEPGFYYEKNRCLAYAMGSKLERRFPIRYSFRQQFFEDNKIYISAKCGTKKVNFPYGVNEAVILAVNNNNITDFQAWIEDNNIVVVSFIPTESTSRAAVSISFIQGKIYDQGEYQPWKSDFSHTFHKNIYNKAKIQPIIKQSAEIIKYFLLIMRGAALLLAIFGSLDTIVCLVSVVSLIPLYLFMGISLPGQISEILQQLLLIYNSTTFYIPYVDQIFQMNSYPIIPIQLRHYNLNIEYFYSTAIVDFIIVGLVCTVYGIIGVVIGKIMVPPTGRISRLIYLKFTQRAYSTISMAIFCIAVPTIGKFAIQYYCQGYIIPLTQQRYENSFWLLTIVLITTSIYSSFIFGHIINLQHLKNSQNNKVDDCYLGMSKMTVNSSLFILNQLVIWVFMPLTILYLHTLAWLILCLLLLSFIMYFYRYWKLYPNKLVYFLRLFTHVLMLCLHVIMALFYLSENYFAMDIKALIIFSFIGVAVIFILVTLNTFLMIALIILAMIRAYKSNPNFINNLFTTQHNKPGPNQTMVRFQDLTSTKNIAKDNSFKITNYSVKFNKSALSNNNFFSRNRKILNDI